MSFGGVLLDRYAHNEHGYQVNPSPPLSATFEQTKLSCEQTKLSCEQTKLKQTP